MRLEPKTPEEWQAAVELASVLLVADDLRRSLQGIPGGPVLAHEWVRAPVIDRERCEEILALGEAAGYMPHKEGPFDTEGTQRGEEDGDE
jgi:hypothetical protein